MSWTENVSEPAVKLLGLAEVLGAAGLLLPALLDVATVLSPIAWACLTVLMVGSVVVHRRRGEPSRVQVALTALTMVATVLAMRVVF